MFKNILLPTILKSISIYLICNVHLILSLENIAYNKPAYQSSTFCTGCEANKAVDGNNSTFAQGGEEPTALNWWKVDLQSVYYISYVVLTPRQNAKVGEMDYVFIGISNFPDVNDELLYPVYPVCRQSPYEVDKLYSSQNFSCSPNTPPGRYVIIQQPTRSPGYLTIAEVQVYGVALDGNSACKGNYYGPKCDKYCNCDKGVKCDQQGICPNGCDVNWKGDHCDIKKFGDDLLIGCSTWRNLSNYLYIRVHTESCAHTCAGYSFTFDSDYYDYCYCSNIAPWVHQCPESCVENCMVYYAVCPNGTYGYDCTLKCNCLNNGRCSYMDGHCQDGCAAGWTGDTCGVRDCRTGNGGCHENEMCIPYSNGISNCQCKDGFYRTSIWSKCQSLSTGVNPINHPEIIGGVVGSVAIICVTIVLIVLIVKCMKRKKGPTPPPRKPSFTIEGVHVVEFDGSTGSASYEIPATYESDLTREKVYKSVQIFDRA